MYIGKGFLSLFFFCYFIIPYAGFDIDTNDVFQKVDNKM